MADRRNTRNAVTARNAAAAAVVALADGGRVRIYSGLQLGAGGALLWESDVLPIPAFGAPVEGIAALLEPVAGPVVESGRAAWYQVVSDISEPLWSGTVGEEDDEDQHNIEVTDSEFVQGGVFILSTLTYEGEVQGN